MLSMLKHASTIFKQFLCQEAKARFRPSLSRSCRSTFGQDGRISSHPREMTNGLCWKSSILEGQDQDEDDDDDDEDDNDDDDGGGGGDDDDDDDDDDAAAAGGGGGGGGDIMR